MSHGSRLETCTFGSSAPRLVTPSEKFVPLSPLSPTEVATPSALIRSSVELSQSSPLVQPEPLRRHGGLHVPLPPPQLVHPERLRHLRGAEGVLHVLLVREHQDRGVPHVKVVDDGVELLRGSVDAVAVQESTTKMSASVLLK